MPVQAVFVDRVGGGQRAYVQTKLCTGGTLRTFLRREENAAPLIERDGHAVVDRASDPAICGPMRLLREVLTAIVHVHAMSTVHGDIKLENVLVDEESGDALLADFDMARIEQEGAGASVMTTRAGGGTPGCVYGA